MSATDFPRFSFSCDAPFIRSISIGLRPMQLFIEPNTEATYFPSNVLFVTCIKVDIMDTIRVQLKHANAKKLLQELENMDIIKVIEQPAETTEPIKPSELRGFLTKEKAKELVSQINETRKDWDARLSAK